jgi:predicted phosphohydrolase
MSSHLRLAVTADLHWGPHARGNGATTELRDFLLAQPPDVFVIAGDVGASIHFDACLQLFAELPSQKALVPGNHDIWVEAEDVRGNSLDVYHRHLPTVCRQLGFTYLDDSPLFLPDADLALVGTMNWYDYSWSLEELRRRFPDEEERLKTKRFSRGRHNDARFVRWPPAGLASLPQAGRLAHDDASFTAEVVATFERHLNEALARVGRVIVIAHHPPFFGLNVPPPDGEPSLDRLLWNGFSGNRALEAVLERHADRIAFAFCGHTHRARENTLGPIRGYNIGGDYHFKRLLLLDWPEGTVEAHTFGAEHTSND